MNSAPLLTLTQAPGLWLPLEQLLDLPMDGESRAQLWRLALEQIDGAAVLPLRVALARHCGQAAAEASAEGQWAVADDHLAEAADAYAAIARDFEERREGACLEQAGLVARLIADVHACVQAEEPPPPMERGALCWRAYQLLLRHQALQVEREPWLSILEEQLVREGGILLRQLATDPAEPLTETERLRLRRQALELLLHLAPLHDPSPEWIGLAVRELLEPELAPVLQGDAAALEAPALRRLLGWLGRLPVAPEAQAAMDLALQRAELTLELLDHAGAPSPPPPPSPPAPVQPKPVADHRLSFNQMGELARHLQLESAAWMRQHGGGSTPVTLSLELDPELLPVQSQPEGLVLNLAPLLEFPDLQQLDQLVQAFFAPLLGEAGSRFRLQEPNGAIYASLSELWQRGSGLAPRLFPGLIYASELWNRCGGSGGLGAASQPWQLPVAELRDGVTLLRPGNVELAALQSVLYQPHGLEEALVEIRRHHHDRQWMERQAERWWMDPADVQENLRRLHTNAGFYASGHAPLESLQRWSQTTIAALLAGPVLFGNDSIVRMFLPIAQLLHRQSGRIPKLQQWPGPQAFYDFIAGQELLFVTPLASEVEAHHRSGHAFALFHDLRIRPYGLRCIPAPMSVYPNRPGRGFDDSLERCLEQVERAHRQRPFRVFTAAAGAYGLPLCQAVHQRYGVSCLYLGNAIHAYFGVEQNTTRGWMQEHRQPEHWIRATGLNGIPGVDRIEAGRYLG